MQPTVDDAIIPAEVGDTYLSALLASVRATITDKFYPQAVQATAVSESGQKVRKSDGLPKEKTGPKPRQLSAGQFVPWNNRRIPISVLAILATLIMAQVRAGVPLTIPMIHCCAVGVFREHNIDWTPSKSWARKFAHRIGITLRHGTRAARSLPGNFLEIQKIFLLRAVWLVYTFNVPKDLFLNADETGVRFLPVRETTWGERGAKQVDITGVGDKRQFTATPVVSASGVVAGTVQVVWQGKTTACCPKQSVQEMFSKRLSHVFSPTHWSTPSTVLQLVRGLYNSYVEPTMLRMQLDPTQQKWILLWDVYTTHRDATVLESLKREFPNLILFYVPASCTSELQPLDKGFNHPWKSMITQQAAKWIQSNVLTQLKQGILPEEVDLRVNKASLVNPFCEWLNFATEGLRSESILSAWKDCGFGDVWEPTSRHFELLAEAIQLSAADQLWTPMESKRSKAGKLPATRIVISGVSGIPSINDETNDGVTQEDAFDSMMTMNLSCPHTFSRSLVP